MIIKKCEKPVRGCFPVSCLSASQAKGLAWTKAPSQHVANGLTKHDEHPLTSRSTLHPAQTFVWPQAPSLRPCGWKFLSIYTGSLVVFFHFPPSLDPQKVSLHGSARVWPKYPCSSPPPAYQNTSLPFPLFCSSVSPFSSASSPSSSAALA